MSRGEAMVFKKVWCFKTERAKIFQIKIISLFPPPDGANLKKVAIQETANVLTPKKLYKVEIFRLSLKDSLNITKRFTQNTKNQPKYVRKMYFIHCYLFFPKELMTRSRKREIWSVSWRLLDNLGELAGRP